MKESKICWHMEPPCNLPMLCLCVCVCLPVCPDRWRFYGEQSGPAVHLLLAWCTKEQQAYRGPSADPASGNEPHPCPTGTALWVQSPLTLFTCKHTCKSNSALRWDGRTLITGVRNQAIRLWSMCIAAIFPVSFIFFCAYFIYALYFYILCVVY